MRLPFARWLGWAVFAALVFGLTVALYFSLTPQPRWQVRLEASEEVAAVESVRGRILTRGRDGITAYDLATGRRLARVYHRVDFTSSNADVFSPDQRYFPFRFDQGRQVALVDVEALEARIIDLRGPGGNDRCPHFRWSTDSKWLVVMVRDENGRNVRSVFAETATGKVLDPADVPKLDLARWEELYPLHSAWADTPNPAITCRLTADEPRRRPMLDVAFHLEFRDSRTGHVARTDSLRSDCRWPPEHRFGQRVIYLRSRIVRQESPADSLRAWLPLGDAPYTQIHCIDLATGGEVGRVEFAEGPNFHFAEPLGLRATWYSDPDHREVLACWEGHLRPAWSWVLGVPLGLALLFAAWRRWRSNPSDKSLPTPPSCGTREPTLPHGTETLP